MLGVDSKGLNYIRVFFVGIILQPQPIGRMRITRT